MPKSKSIKINKPEEIRITPNHFGKYSVEFEHFNESGKPKLKLNLNAALSAHSYLIGQKLFDKGNNLIGIVKGIEIDDNNGQTTGVMVNPTEVKAKALFRKAAA